MDFTLKQTIHSCIGAVIPAIAVTTTETDTVIREVCEYAAKYSHLLMGQEKRRRVFVWRESIGFEEYALFSKVDGTTTQVDKLTEECRDVKCQRVPDPTRRTSEEDSKPRYLTYAPEDLYEGTTIPFAVDFADRYNVKEETRGAIFILRDWHRYIDVNGDHVDRQLKLFEDLVKGEEKTVIMLSPIKWGPETIPIELNQHIYHVDFPIPNKVQRSDIIENMVSGLLSRGKYPKVNDMGAKEIEDVIDATAGLSRVQMCNVLSMSLAYNQSLDVNYILNEKRKLVEQAGFQMTRPLIGFEQIGGLTPLKEWAVRLRKRFTVAARDYGFPRYPRGLLMAGVPGCGKSAISKALANEWNMNLLTVQATDLKGSLVGESEAKVHRLLATAEAAAPIIVFVDEAEKLLGKSEGIHDGGAHDAVLSQFLSFMQENDSGVFFVFTANNMEKFAPELVDRFEGRYFIDLPGAEERKEILRIHLELRKQDTEKFNIAELVRTCKDFSGRNIEDSIEEAMGIAFNEDRELTMEDLVTVFGLVVPTSKTKKAEIETMRSYVDNGLMRQANDLPEFIDDEEGGSVRDFM